MTALLLDKGFVVTAIEPNESMISKADVPRAIWVKGTFEGSRLENGSQRWAIAAQAFHWADPKRSLPEIRRILQPDCLFTILWNNRVTTECNAVRDTELMIHKHIPEFDEAYRRKTWPAILQSTGDFLYVNQHTVRHSIPMSHERYLNLWKSHNRLNTIAGPARFAIFFSELQDYLERYPREEIEVGYDCEAWSARRKT